MGGKNSEDSVRVDQSSARIGKARYPTSDLHVNVANESNDEPILPTDDRDDGRDSGGVTRPILGVVVATAILYLSGDVLLPLTMASILAVALSPIATRLETLVGRFVSSALVVILAMIAIGAIGFFLTVELTSVAVEVAGYSDNIAAKLTNLEGSTPAWLQTVEEGVKDVERRLQKTAPGSKGSPSKLAQVQATPARYA